jgi:hypothetical protein
VSETPILSAWSSFYVLTGSSAAALTGLMFVVISLTTGREARSAARNRDGISTFSTPTVMHFAGVMLVSAVLCAPWRRLAVAAILLAAMGLFGLGYILRVAVRARRFIEYRADLEDWAWYMILPFVAYGALFGGAVALPMIPEDALFAIGLGVVLLILIGIRNAWDVVTFLAMGGGAPPPP